MKPMPPVEFSQLGLQTDAFVYSDEKSWRGPCTACGGKRRFVIFTDHEFPLWHGWCDACGRRVKFWERIAHQPLSAEQKAKYAEASQTEANRRNEYRRAKLAEFSKHEIAAELAERMGDEQRGQWTKWGIPEPWQKYLGLGYTPDKIYHDANGDNQHSPAYVIPYYHHTDAGKELITLQYRLDNPPTPNDRYRFEYGLGASYYNTTPTKPLTDLAIICEGAKKAMVTKIHGGVNDKTTVLAVPAKNSWGGILDTVKDCGRVFVVLDPDGEDWAVKMAGKIGKAARIVRLHVKIDDGILNYGLGKTELTQAFRWAERQR